eukprot:3294701-Pleurochrysis_carterae.AAC.6
MSKEQLRGAPASNWQPVGTSAGTHLRGRAHTAARCGGVPLQLQESWAQAREAVRRHRGEVGRTELDHD